MMPPPGAKRPPRRDAARDSPRRSKPRSIGPRQPIRIPGTRPFQRLNRAEYARSIRDLIGLDIDVTTFLPPDTVSGGFDNVADVQAPSAT